MKNVSRVIEHDDSRHVQSSGTRVPLTVKAVFALILAVAPLLAAAIFVAFEWGALGGFPPALQRLLATQITLPGFSITAAAIILVLLALAGICIGLLAFESLVITPVRRLVAWMRLARERDFVNVPVIPLLRRDEIGELERLASSSAAYFSGVKDQNIILMEEKTLFVTIAAHQLRTPLTALLWSIEALLSPQTAEAERQKLMQDVDTTLKRMRLIINHILASANVEGGRFGYVFQLIDIAPPIQKLIDEFKPVADSRGVSILFEQSEHLPQVYADIERITLAIFDLISNAIDYTPKGGSITVSAVVNAGKVEVAIADTGIGISEAEIPKLFTKFYRGDRARHLRPDGSGLGLFLVRNIVHSHGSDIAVTSKEGSGSRFSFSLPVSKPTP